MSPALLQAIAKGDPRDPAGFPIDINRPALQNPDGSYSTEKTITVGFGDRYYNIPTIWDGVELPSDGAVLMAKDALRRGVQFPEHEIERAYQERVDLHRVLAEHRAALAAIPLEDGL